MSIWLAPDARTVAECVIEQRCVSSQIDYAAVFKVPVLRQVLVMCDSFILISRFRSFSTPLILCTGSLKAWILFQETSVMKWG